MSKSKACLLSLPNELVETILDKVSLNLLLVLRGTCRTLKACSENLLHKKAEKSLAILPQLPKVPIPLESLKARQVIAEYAAHNKNYDTWASNTFDVMMYDAFMSLESLISGVQRSPLELWSTEFKSTLHGLLTKPKIFAICPSPLSEVQRDNVFNDIFLSLMFLLDRRSRVPLDSMKISLLSTVMELSEFYDNCWGKSRESIICSRFLKRCIKICKV